METLDLKHKVLHLSLIPDPNAKYLSYITLFHCIMYMKAYIYLKEIMMDRCIVKMFTEGLLNKCWLLIFIKHSNNRVLDSH